MKLIMLNTACALVCNDPTDCGNCGFCGRNPSPKNIYRGDWICGSYHAEQHGLTEDWWYTWDFQPIRPATESEKRAGDGIA